MYFTVCKKGYFGEDCNEICDNCKECDNYYGTCIGGKNTTQTDISNIYEIKYE